MVNVPADAVRPLQRIVLHAARPPGSNHPTADGVAGAEKMLALFGPAGPDDVAICLLSGGGSALLPAPDGVSLEDKQAVTKLLHACGATIHEMNAVRKHLSQVKGGRLAQAFRGQRPLQPDHLRRGRRPARRDRLRPDRRRTRRPSPTPWPSWTATGLRAKVPGGRRAPGTRGRRARSRRRRRNCRRTSTTSSSATTPWPCGRRRRRRRRSAIAC